MLDKKVSKNHDEVEKVEESVNNFFYYLHKGRREVKDLLLRLQGGENIKSRRKEEDEERKKVFVCGMGGSGIAGRLLRDVFIALKKNIDVEVVSSYSLPPYAKESDFYIFISYSGNTEETLSCFKSALGVAKRENIIAITRGGKLKKKGEEVGVKVITVNKNMTPRASLPFLFTFSLYALVIFEVLGEDEANRIMEDIINLKDMKEEMKRKGREIARQVGDNIIISYGWGKYKGAMYRAKTQFNENAKHPAFYEELSESNHNFIQVFDTPGKAKLKQMAHLFVVEEKRDDIEGEKIHARISFLMDAIERNGGYSVVLTIPAGLGNIRSIFYVVYVFDWASVELGKMKGININEVDIIESLKKYLKSLSEAE